MCASAAGQPQVITFNVSSGNWQTAGNWNPAIVPGSTDRAVIPSGRACVVSDTREIDTIDVQGTLTIAHDAILQLHNVQNLVTPNPDNSIVDGTLTLDSDFGGTLGGEIQFLTASHSLTGTGLVDAWKGSRIFIARGRTLTNLLSSGGKIYRETEFYTSSSLSPTPAYFDNRGKVESRIRIIFGENVVLTDVAGARWDLEDDFCPFMEFHTAANLHGDFKGDANGKFRFSATVATCGTWIRNGSDVLIDVSGAKFRYQKFDKGNQCCVDSGSPTFIAHCDTDNLGSEITANDSCGLTCGGN